MTAYQEGVVNGRLCRKYSNQHTPKPTDREWAEAYEEAYANDYPEGKAEFIRGCNDGWRKSSGSLKV